MALSSSEMQLRLALAMIILGFEERVDKETRDLLEIEQAMQQLQRQREALLEQRKKDTDYLAASGEADEPASAGQRDASPEAQETLPPPAIAGETHEESDIDPRAKEVLVYLFSLPQAAVHDWRTTIQRALNLPEPPKMRGHSVYKAVQHAYRLIESLHNRTLSHPSDSLMNFYTQYFIEGERWADFKDTMNEWGIA